MAKTIICKTRKDAKQRAEGGCKYFLSVCEASECNLTTDAELENVEGKLPCYRTKRGDIYAWVATRVHHVIHAAGLQQILEAAEHGVDAKTNEGRILGYEIKELKKVVDAFLATNPIGPFNLVISDTID